MNRKAVAKNVLHICTLVLQPDMVDLLVQNGADINATTRSGETIFGMVMCCHVDNVNYLRPFYS